MEICLALVFEISSTVTVVENSVARGTHMCTPIGSPTPRRKIGKKTIKRRILSFNHISLWSTHIYVELTMYVLKNHWFPKKKLKDLHDKHTSKMSLHAVLIYVTVTDHS